MFTIKVGDFHPVSNMAAAAGNIHQANGCLVRIGRPVGDCRQEVPVRIPIPGGEVVESTKISGLPSILVADLECCELGCCEDFMLGHDCKKGIACPPGQVSKNCLCDKKRG